MPGARITEPQKHHYLTLRSKGFSQEAAARQAGFSKRSGVDLERGLANSSGDAWRASRREAKVEGPKRREELVPEALAAFDDFELFRRRYMGHVSTPWQVETAQTILGAVESGVREYIVENVAPGLGKSTLLVDIAAWLTVRDRSVRGLFISRAQSLAERNVARLRRYLERTSPVQARPEDVAKGIAADAVATLAGDFGRFKPATSGEVWRRAEFVVEQVGGGPIEEKEPTWSAFGFDSEWIGNRFTVMLGDDLDSTRSTRSFETVEKNRETFDSELEPRLEPGGALVVCQQRLSAGDFSAHCLGKVVQVDEGDPDADDVAEVAQYRHIVYKVHDDARCLGKETHRLGAPAWPEGCLLDPHRMSWRDVRKAMADPQRFEVVYQQGDVQANDVLVKDVWVWGGNDPDDGSLCPGVMDSDRGLCELPSGLVPPVFSIASVDPSPTRMWALQWWCHAPEAANRTFLMDLERKAMPSNELLDWDADRLVHTGLMEEWQARSVRLGYPITHWVIEINAAQRFLLPYDHVRRWQQKWGVSIVPHSTGLNKLDPQLGPWLLRSKFKTGQIRLPARQGTEARWRSMKLVDEVTHWPLPGYTDDEVMACWFLFVHLPNLAVSQSGQRLRRPSYMRVAG